MADNSNSPGTGVATLSPAQISIRKMRLVLSEEGVQKQFQNALGKDSASFIASIMEIYSGDSTLVTCDPKKVTSEALKAAILKLPIIKSLGFAWVIPYKKNGVAVPQFQIGYKGYIQLAMRTGQYRTINADVVYEGELQKLNKLSGEIAFEGERKSDTAVGYFAYFELLNGFSKTLYMTKENVIKHAKRYSKSYGKDASPWTTEFDAMALVTLLRNLLSHYGYLSIEMMNTIASDIEADSPEEERNTTVQQQGNKKNIDAENVDYEDIVNKQVEKENKAVPTQSGPSYA